MDNTVHSSIDPMGVVRELAALPHRGATTVNEKKAAEILTRSLQSLGASVERQDFRTPKTYISEVWWMLAAMTLTLIFTPYLSWIALVIILFIVISAFRYFDWRSSPLSLLPPQADSQNIIGKDPHHINHDTQIKRLILMAHYDSAPTSLLYHPVLVKNFRQSLLINLGLMAGAVLIILLEVLKLGGSVTAWLRWLLAVNFIIQGIISSIDYFRYGFTNGAADNATGVAIALATAESLWGNPIPGWQVDVVLTSAEEAGMVGSRHFYLANRDILDPRTTYIVNFDNLGKGDVKIITRTGSMTTVVYDNAVVDAALHTAASDPRFQHIKPGAWHTADFDSIWFAREGIPSLTLSAQDEQKQIPFLHRPDDTIDNVDANVVLCAIDFAQATIRRLAASI